HYTNVGTSSDVGIFHDCEGTFDYQYLFKLTVTIPGLDPFSTHHLVEIGAYNEEGTPCFISRPTSTEINGNNAEHTLLLYPNPVSNNSELYVQIMLSESDLFDVLGLSSSNIVISNMSGNIINSFEFGERVNNGTISVPVNNLSPGMYFMTISFPNGYYLTSRFV